MGGTFVEISKRGGSAASTHWRRTHPRWASIREEENGRWGFFVGSVDCKYLCQCQVGSETEGKCVWLAMSGPGKARG